MLGLNLNSFARTKAVYFFQSYATHIHTTSSYLICQIANTQEINACGLNYFCFSICLYPMPDYINAKSILFKQRLNLLRSGIIIFGIQMLKATIMLSFPDIKRKTILPVYFTQCIYEVTNF